MDITRGMVSLQSNAWIAIHSHATSEGLRHVLSGSVCSLSEYRGIFNPVIVVISLDG